jgi:hypothetical protein
VKGLDEQPPQDPIRLSAIPDRKREHHSGRTGNDTGRYYPEQRAASCSHRGGQESQPMTPTRTDPAQSAPFPGSTSLEFADIDWDRRVLRVRNKPHLNPHVKNYQERHIRLNSQALRRCRRSRHFYPNRYPVLRNPRPVEVPQVPVTSTKGWCGGPESNRHGPCGPRDFKSLASTSSATPAG